MLVVRKRILCRLLVYDRSRLLLFSTFSRVYVAWRYGTPRRVSEMRHKLGHPRFGKVEHSGEPDPIHDSRFASRQDTGRCKLRILVQRKPSRNRQYCFIRYIILVYCIKAFSRVLILLSTLSHSLSISLKSIKL